MMEYQKILVLQPYGGAGEFIIKDSIEGLKDLGHNIEVCDLNGTFNSTIFKKLNSFNPDFVFTIDHNGLIRPLIKELKERGITYISWFTGNPLHWTEKERLSYAVSPLCIIFVPDETYIPTLKGFGYERIHYLPFATNPNIFRRIELNKEQLERYGCKISFVGNPLYSYVSIYQNFLKEKVKDAKTRVMIKEVVKIQSQNPLLNTSDILDVVQRAYQYRIEFIDQEDREAIEALLEQVAMSIYRKDVLEAVSDMDLHIYGGEGWEEVMDGQGRYRGPINNRTELPILYNASKINLNITTSQQRKGLPMRVFDIGGCGGFMLSDYRQDLGRLFVLGEEVICYSDKEDLRRKVEYFLARSEERDEIRERFYKRVLKDHTYKVRMQEVIEIVRG